MRNMIVALALAAGTCSAAADTVHLDLQSITGKTMVVGGHGTVRAGQADMLVLPGGTSTEFTPGERLRTFCIDVTARVVDPDFYELRDFDAYVGDATKSDAIKRLYTYALNTGLDFSQHETAATFQVVIWDVLYDYDGTAGSLDTLSGSFRVTSNYSGEPLLTTQLAAAAHSGALNRNLVFTALDSLNGGQDQLYYTVIPLPGAAGLAAAGLLGVGLVSRRRRA